MADLFAEVDEMMRQERMAKIWHEYGSYIIAFVVGTILLTAILSGYKAWNSSVQEKQTAALMALQDDPNYPNNVLEADELDLRGGLRGIAYLSAANSFLGEDKRDEALTIYERAASDNSVSDEFSHLADLMIVRLTLDSEDAKAEELLGRLEAIYSASKSPWVYHAHLEAAVVEAHLNQDYVTAQTHLNIIRDAQGLPQSLYAKAESLDHVYRLKAAGE